MDQDLGVREARRDRRVIGNVIDVTVREPKADDIGLFRRGGPRSNGPVVSFGASKMTACFESSSITRYELVAKTPPLLLRIFML